MLIVAGWVIGVFLVLVGSVWLYFNIRLRPLHEVELELMKIVGKHQGDPDWMEDLNVAISEASLAANKRNKYRAIATIVIGILIIVGLIIRALQL